MPKHSTHSRMFMSLFVKCVKYSCCLAYGFMHIVKTRNKPHLWFTTTQTVMTLILNLFDFGFQTVTNAAQLSVRNKFLG